MHKRWSNVFQTIIFRYIYINNVALLQNMVNMVNIRKSNCLELELISMCAGFKRTLPLPSHSASSLIDPKDAAPVQNRFTISTAGSTCKQTRESLKKIIQPSSLEVLGVPTSNTSNTSTGLSPSAPSEPSGPKGYALVTQNCRDQVWYKLVQYQDVSGHIRPH